MYISRRSRLYLVDRSELPLPQEVDFLIPSQLLLDAAPRHPRSLVGNFSLVTGI